MPPTNPRHARHTAIVHQLRSRTWVSATSLAARFGVNARTIYRDIEELIAFGIPIESVAGRGGGDEGTTDQVGHRLELMRANLAGLGVTVPADNSVADIVTTIERILASPS